MKKFNYDSNFKPTKINAKYKKVNSALENDGLSNQEAMGEMQSNSAKKISKKRIAQVSALSFLVLIALFVGIFGKNKKVDLILDGQKYTKKTNHFINSMLLDKLTSNINAKELKVTNQNELGTLVAENQVVEISTLKTLNLKINNKTEKKETYADTLKDFMSEIQGSLKKKNSEYSYRVQKYNKADQSKVLMKDVKQLNIDLIRTVKKDSTKTKPYKTKYVDNEKLASGKTKVKQKGEDKKYVLSTTTTYVNGKKTKTRKKISKVIKKGQDEIIYRGTKVTAPKQSSKSTNNSGSSAASDSVWDQLAQCESGGNWASNTGNGFYGGLQFMASTWQAVAPKVGVSVSMPHNATREQQIKVASYLQKQSGWGQWPACTAKLGLR